MGDCEAGMALDHRPWGQASQSIVPRGHGFSIDESRSNSRSEPSGNVQAGFEPRVKSASGGLRGG